MKVRDCYREAGVGHFTMHIIKRDTFLCPHKEAYIFNTISYIELSIV